jgi:hypothetical protein
MLDYTAEISVDRATWRSGFVHPCCKEWGYNISFFTGNIRTSVFQPVAIYRVAWRNMKVQLKDKRPWTNDGYHRSLGVTENNREWIIQTGEYSIYDWNATNRPKNSGSTLLHHLSRTTRIWRGTEMGELILMLYRSSPKQYDVIAFN